MTPTGVSEWDEHTPRGDTTPSPKKKDIQQRRRRVSSLMRKRNREGERIISSAREMQRAGRDPKLLKREIRRVRNSIPQRDIDALVLGFPQRVERTVRSDRRFGLRR
jgi:hypothetical protein